MKRCGFDHPKINGRLCKLLGIKRYAARGIVESLWHFTAKHAPAGDVGKWSDEEIADSMDWDREPAELVDALVAAKLLDRQDDPSRLTVHDWKDHCEDSVHVALARKRLFFADGSPPKLTRMAKKERAELESHYRVAEKRISHAQKRTKYAQPAPAPAPTPGPLPEPWPIRAPALDAAQGAETTQDAENMHDAHKITDPEKICWDEATGDVERIQEKLAQVNLQEPSFFDRVLFARAAVLKQSLGERWLWDSVEGVLVHYGGPQRDRPACHPCAYLLGILRSKCREMGRNFDQLARAIVLPRGLIRPPERRRGPAAEFGAQLRGVG